MFGKVPNNQSEFQNILHTWTLAVAIQQNVTVETNLKYF